MDIAGRVQSAIRRIRGAGSRDRRLYRELIFTWFRYREWIDPARSTDPILAGRLLIFLADPNGEAASARAHLPGGFDLAEAGTVTARADVLSAQFPDRNFRPTLLEPNWLASEYPPGGTTRLPHILPRPPIWLRAVPEDIQALVRDLQTLGLQTQASEEIPGALAAPTDSRIETLEAFRNGRIEIQDISSQVVLLQAAPAKGESWLDACAGAGGKSLHLARLVGPAGSVTAIDRRAPALAELRKRAERGGFAHIRCLSQRLESAPREAFDGVLVDAPCSGSGTWRRHPFLRHQTNPETLDKMARKQVEILGQAANCVRPGGRLVYATCSLCRTENEAVIERFLLNHPSFQPSGSDNPLSLAPATGPGHYILPERFNGDGFYVVILHRETPA